MGPKVPLPWGSFRADIGLLYSIPCRTQRATIRSILKPPPKPSRFDHPHTPKALSAAAALERKSHLMPHRTGVLAKKKGMSVYWDTESGNRLPCTVLQLDRNQVVAHKTFKRHGYYAVQMGFGWRHPNNLTRAELGHCASVGVSPKEALVEFRVRGERGLLPVGTVLNPSWFKVGQYVDTRSNTKGKGFAGGMKKHGWSGQPASHGQSLTHRTMGSAGGSQGSGSRVIPGKKMPGRMGGQQHTVQNLEVLKTDDENGILLVKGHVSGPKNSLVQIQDAKKIPGQVADLNLPIIPETFVIETAKEEEAAA